MFSRAAAGSGGGLIAHDDSNGLNHPTTDLDHLAVEDAGQRRFWTASDRRVGILVPMVQVP